MDKIVKKALDAAVIQGAWVGVKFGSQRGADGAIEDMVTAFLEHLAADEWGYYADEAKLLLEAIRDG